MQCFNIKCHKMLEMRETDNFAHGNRYCDKCFRKMMLIKIGSD